MVSKLFTIIIFFSLALFPAAESHAKKGSTKSKSHSPFAKKPDRLLSACGKVAKGVYLRSEYKKCNAYQERKERKK